MDPNEDTEWYELPTTVCYVAIANVDCRNDALRKQGIIPEKAPDQTELFEEALHQAIQEAEANRLENLNLEELAELEDDEDEEFLESYKSQPPSSAAFDEIVSDLGRQKRMAEIREFQKKSRFGSVEPLAKPDFVKEVTDASASTWVFVHLFKD
jgi:hypothetical protein